MLSLALHWPSPQLTDDAWAKSSSAARSPLNLSVSTLPAMPATEPVELFWKFWVDARFRLFGLEAGGYQPLERSRFLPDLDLHRTAEIVAATPRAEQAQAVWRFRESLAGPPAS